MSRYGIFLGMTIAAGAILLALDPETTKIMPFVDDPGQCRQCHVETDFGTVVKDPALACDALCLSCHKNVTVENHHAVGMKPGVMQAKNIELTRMGKIACITCHDLRRQRFDSSPWMAQSLFDKMFKKNNQYKTYYLIIQNDKGQLCRTCH
jgi:hypothetical protein